MSLSDSECMGDEIHMAHQMSDDSDSANEDGLFDFVDDQASNSDDNDPAPQQKKPRTDPKRIASVTIKQKVEILDARNQLISGWRAQNPDKNGPAWKCFQKMGYFLSDPYNPIICGLNQTFICVDEAPEVASKPNTVIAPAPKRKPRKQVKHIDVGQRSIASYFPTQEKRVD